MSTPARTGRIICTGLGPGDPDLMSVRSDRLLRNAAHVAYFRKAGHPGVARQIVNGIIPDTATEYPMEYPVTTELPFGSAEYNTVLAAFYDDWANRLEALAQTKDVVVLCEGDPFFYGSFMHLHARLSGRVPINVVPGITGMSGCWTATGQPFTWGDDVLTVLMSTLPEEELTARAANSDALVFMKIGRNIAKVARALKAAGKLDRAWVIERGTMAEQKVQKLADLRGDVPYFAIVVVHGNGRRP